MAVDNYLIHQKDSIDMNMAVKEEMPLTEADKSGTIHSGHFMVSRVHDDVNNDEDEEEVLPFSSPDPKGFNFTNASRETQLSYNFGNANIDSSLTKLFECMTLAYSGTISSPRWKQFRGLHVTQKERIRLNNLIWREWHMQYIYHWPPMVCQFASPLSDDIHSRPEAVVLEGKYWKRRLDTVTSEYKKCRRYFKERIYQQRQLGTGLWKTIPEWELLERVKDVTFLPTSSINQISSTDLNIMQTDMTEDMDFNNELFSTLNQPFAFPNPRELSQLGYSEWIQPGLVQLQPNLEEFMDIDTMQELLSITKIPSSSVFSDTSVSHVDMQASGSSGLTLVDFLTNNDNLSNAINASGNNRNTDSMVASSAMDSVSTVIPSPEMMPNDPSLLIQQQQQQSQQAILNASLLQQQQQIINSPPSNIALQSSNDANNARDSVSILLNNSGQLNGNVTIMPQGLTISPQQHQQFLITTPNLNPSQRVTVMSNISDLYSGNGGTNSLGTIMGSGDLASLSQQSPSSSISSLPMFNNNVNNNKACLPVKNPTVVLQPNRQQQHLQPLQPKVDVQSQPQNASSLTTLLQLQPKSPSSNPNSPLAQALATPSGLLNRQNQQILSQGSGRSSTTPRKSKGKQSGGSDSRKQGASNCIVLSNASGMITDLAALAQSNSNISTLHNRKKDGSFAVPSVVPRKPRMIAPAPVAPSPPPPPPAPQSSSESYLAQLLKKGTYPGALINVKTEPLMNSVTPASPLTGGRPTVTATVQPSSSTLSSQLPLLTQQLQTVAPVLQSPNRDLVQRPVVQGVANIGGVPPNVIDISNMSHKDLTTILNAISPPQIKTQASPTPPPTPSIISEVKAVSPINMVASPLSSALPTSPPISIKRSPSPAMEIGSLSEPSSPFPSVSMSPCSADDNSQPGDDSPFLRENKKAAHLSAEQKRRFNLKMGFDLLQQLVPSLSQNPKVSKATMLQKTADYCKKLKLERSQMRKEATVLKQEIESLNCAISNVQSQLPETGVPVTRQRRDQMKEMFDEYVRTRTIDNWKFWIFSVIMSCLYDSYCNTVSTVSLEEMCRTSLTWVDQSCSLVNLRPNVLNALRKLSTTTSILTEPEKVKEEAIQNVSKPANPRGHLGFLS